MNKGIIIGIIIAVAIAIGFGVLMSTDNTIPSPQTDENITETEQVTEPKSYSIHLEESIEATATP